MKAFILTAAVVGLALGAAAPAFAGEKKCDAGSEWDQSTQKCVKKQS